MYIITARRITSGELLKQRKGLRIARGYGTSLPGSSPFALTMPDEGLRIEEYADAVHCLPPVFVLGSAPHVVVPPARASVYRAIIGS
jgi:hypothetical protein